MPLMIFQSKRLGVEPSIELERWRFNTDAVITGNAGCALQIQAAIKESGHTIRVFHPMDLLDLSYRGLPPA